MSTRATVMEPLEAADWVLFLGKARVVIGGHAAVPAVVFCGSNNAGHTQMSQLCVVLTTGQIRGQAWSKWRVEGSTDERISCQSNP